MMKVIVALDQSDFSDQVVNSVINRHWDKDVQFKLITALEPMNWEAISCVEWNKTAEKLLKRRDEVAHDILTQARKKFEENLPHCPVHIDIRNGSARFEITAAATEWMADKIIVGAHGHSPNRLLPGSVARNVARYAACSVEMVRLKHIDHLHEKHKLIAEHASTV